MADPSTPPPPKMNDWTGEPVVSARPNETARNKDHKEMRVDWATRTLFLTTHNYVVKEKASGYSAQQHKYPRNALYPFPNEQTEAKGVTNRFLWVGMMCGNDPKKYAYKTSGRRKNKKPAKKAATSMLSDDDEEEDTTSPAPRDDWTMPVVMRCEEDIPESAKFFVLCDPNNKEPGHDRRWARTISFDGASIFFFEEFLGPKPNDVTIDLLAESAESAIKYNCRYWCSRSKNRKGGDLVESATNLLQKNLSTKPLVVTSNEQHHALLNMFGNLAIEKRDAKCLDLMDGLLSEMAPGLTTMGPGTSDTGVQMFWDYENFPDFTVKDAKVMVDELSAAHPIFPKRISPALICRIRVILSEDTLLFSRLYRSGLPFFLELCLKNWPAKKTSLETPSEAEIQVVEQALDTQRIHVRYSNTITTSDERTELPEIDEEPSLNVVGSMTALRDLLSVRREYDTAAMESILGQLGAVLEHHDIPSLMVHLSRVIDKNSCSVLQHQLGVLQAFAYSFTTRMDPGKMDSKIIQFVDGIIEMLREQGGS